MNRNLTTPAPEIEIDQEPELCKQLNWAFDEQSFLQRLTVVKKSRDSAAHWDVDAPGAEREAVPNGRHDLANRQSLPLPC